MSYSAVVRIAPVLFLLASSAHGQSPISLALSSAAVVPGGVVSLNLSVASSGPAPVALQWKLVYSPSEINVLTVAAGPAASAAGKMLGCVASAGSHTCALWGMNDGTIPDGVVAVVTATLNLPAGMAQIGVTDVVAASQNATSLPIQGTAGAVTAITQQAPSVILSTLSCTPASLGPSASASCAITLSEPAPSGGATVALSSSSPTVSVPATVHVTAGSVSASFPATAKSIAADAVVVVSAALNGTARSFSLSLAAPTTPYSLFCSSKSLHSNESVLCTLSLSKPAGPDGVIVSVSSNNALVSVPATVAVPAGAKTAAFNAAAQTIETGQAAIVAATLAGASASVTLSLIGGAPGTVQLIACETGELISSSGTHCIALLSVPAPPLGAVMTVTSDNALLATPSAMPVAPGATSVRFPVLVASVTADQAATLTVGYAGGSRSFTLKLLPLPALETLNCSPAWLAPAAKLSCTVTLTHANPGSQAVVTLVAGTNDVVTPASVAVPAGATTASFTASVAPILFSAKAAITATMNGNSQTLVLTREPVTISSISCTPAFIQAGSTTNCRFTLTRPAEETSTISLESDSQDLTVPSTLTVASSATGGVFSITAGAPRDNVSAVLKATLGNQSRTTSITLLAAPVISTISCAETVMVPGGVTACTVWLSNSAGDLAVSMQIDGGFVAPGSVLVPAGASSAGFSVTAAKTAPQVATLSAGLGGSGFTLTLRTWPLDSISALSCNPPHLVGGGALDCAVELAEAASAGGIAVELQADSQRLLIPGRVIVPAEARSSRFQVHALVGDRDENVRLSAIAPGAVRTVELPISGLRPVDLVCLPKVVQAGGEFACEALMSSSDAPESARLEVSGTSESLKLPQTIATRPRQSRLNFKVSVDPRATGGEAAVQVGLGTSTVLDRVIVDPPLEPVLDVPGTQLAEFGKEVAFSVSAVDLNGLALGLSAEKLPPGASFDPETGRFAWIPAETDQGEHTVVFKAANAAGASSTGEVLIEVTDGKPAIDAILNGASGHAEAACSRSGVATITGRWLTGGDEESAAASDDSLDLGGPRVKVNGEYVPVLHASLRRVDFLCPALDAGTVLEISVETEAGETNQLRTVMQEIAPGLFSIDRSGRGQGAVFFAGTRLPAAIRDYRTSGQPAQPGDVIALRATGIGAIDHPASVLVRIGPIPVPASSIAAAPGLRGVHEITATVPAGLPESEAVPVSLEVTGPDGSVIESNTVTIAVEDVRP